MLRGCTLTCALLLFFGCTSYGVVENRSSVAPEEGHSYSLKNWSAGRSSGDVSVLLAFSGGGTRAAALSYGVLQELRDSEVSIGGQPKRMLDEVDAISSVSGGSFTAAYYGLHGDAIFKDFERLFLKRNIESDLFRGLFNPLRWFSSKGRTEMAVSYYEESLFRGATYADMILEDHPIILINASDLGHGVRFSFIQEYFNLLCSDLSSFPVARAVAASSAVPVLFNPVVLENYPGCGEAIPDWLSVAQERASDEPQISMLTSGLDTYLDKGRRKYAHFVDGGITDNLGLRALYDIIELSGGPHEFLRKTHQQTPRYIVIISVNASTNPQLEMDETNEQPSVQETLSAMSDVQLHRYNTDTLDLIEKSLGRWAHELSTPARPIKQYFIQLKFEDVKELGTLSFLNRLPTGLYLTDEQADRTMNAGRLLLRNNTAYRDLLTELKR